MPAQTLDTDAIYIDALESQKYNLFQSGSCYNTDMENCFEF